MTGVILAYSRNAGMFVQAGIVILTQPDLRGRRAAFRERVGNRLANLEGCDPFPECQAPEFLMNRYFFRNGLRILVVKPKE
jgi:hypothetical protein